MEKNALYLFSGIRLSVCCRLATEDNGRETLGEEVEFEWQPRSFSGANSELAFVSAAKIREHLNNC